MSDWERVSAENLVRHKGGTYYLQAKIGGKPVRKSLRTQSLRTAKTKRDALMADLRLKANVFKHGESWNLQEAAEVTKRYYAAIPSYQVKPKTMEYRTNLIEVLKKTLPDRSLSTWTPADMQTWWTCHEIRRYSPNRRNNYLGTLRKMVALAMKAGVLFSDPTTDLQRVPVRSKKPSLPPSGVLPDIVESIRSQNQPYSVEAARFVEFLAYCGCRVSEARAIKWSDVGSDSIAITGGDEGTKNHETRHVPIIADMRELLDTMRAESTGDYIFTMKSPWNALNNACLRLGLPHMRVHDLRHLFATQCIEAGVDIPTVSRWLGHKDGGVLAMRTYGHLRDEHSMRAARMVRFK